MNNYGKYKIRIRAIGLRLKIIEKTGELWRNTLDQLPQQPIS